MNLAQRSNVLESHHSHERVPIRFIHVGRNLARPPEVIQEFGYRVDSGNQQMISGTGTGHVEQVPLGVVNLLQIGVVTDRLETLLQGNYFVVAGHHNHGPKLQTLGEMHCADRNVPVGDFDVFIKNLESSARFLDGGARTIKLRC